VFLAVVRSLFLRGFCMLNVVTVYVFMEPEADQLWWKNDCSLQLTRLGQAIVPGIEHGPDAYHQIAAEGWQKVVGISRRAVLKELGAPAQIIAASTSASALLETNESWGSFREAPSALRIGSTDSQWLYDNSIETWLITVEEST